MKRRLLTRDFLDEHFVPELELETAQYFDHIRRYLFAQQFVWGRTVLDIACGTGYGSNILRLGGAKQVLGIDLSSEALAYAATQWGAAGLLCGDAHALPLKSASLDVVVSFETIEHLAEPKRFLLEAARVLKPDGDLILSTPNRNVVSPGSVKPFSPYHTFEPTYAELRMLLEESGWKIIEMRGLIHSPRMEAVVSSSISVPFSRSGGQIAWAAYARKWARSLLPRALYEWQSRIRRIPQLSIADSVLTENATESSFYFVVRCKR